MKALATLYAFNRGLISKLALARQDLKRMALSAETFVNWMPRVLGSMMLRPGSTYKHSTKDNAAAAHIPFIYSTDDTAIVEFTTGAMRVMVDDVLVTRPAVATTITNGDFAASLASWTDSDEAGATSSWNSVGYMQLEGTGTAYAVRAQSVTVAVADRGFEHALAINVFRGTVILKVGTSSAAPATGVAADNEDRVTQVALRQGRHSIAFIPDAATIYITLQSNDDTAVLVKSVAFEAVGAMTLVSPYTSAAHLQGVRHDTSGDVMFLACPGVRQRRIERQAASPYTPTVLSRSWSLVEYIPEDGPFRGQNLSTTTMTVSAISGSAVTLTASNNHFKSTSVGALYRLGSRGQTVEITAASPPATDTWSTAIKVTGVREGRIFNLLIEGMTSIGNVMLQKSVGTDSDWVDYQEYGNNVDTNINDNLDNQIIYYRVGLKSTTAAVGTIHTRLIFSSGSIKGVGIVTSYTSGTVVTVDVLSPFGGTEATDTWWEGQWSDRRGWPSAVAFYDGRLFWAGKGMINGSVSDAFSTFDDTTVGDAGPIKRSLGGSAGNVTNWILPLSLMVTGTQGAELVAKSSSLDEPLTPTLFAQKAASTLGSANMPAVKIDTGGVYVQRNGSRVYELAMDAGTFSYSSNDLTAIVPEIGRPNFVRIAVQRMPDTRIHLVRSDGRVAILIFDPVEKVTCWALYEPACWQSENLDAAVEDVVILPGTVEDAVYYCIRRNIGGAFVRYLERWATEDEAKGEAATNLTDSSIVYSGASTATITGLSHLEGRLVTVWGNTKDLGFYQVVGGSITLTEAVTLAYVGLAYGAQFKSAKLALGSATGNPLTQRQRLDHVGLLLADTHARGLQYGQDDDHLDDLPLIDQGAPVDIDSIHGSYSEDSVELNGTWTTDTRLVLQASSPRACTVLACVISGAGHDKG